MDISLCRNENCTLKNTCKRYLSKPDTYQCYFNGNFINGKCEFYIKVKDGRNT